MSSDQTAWTKEAVSFYEKFRKDHDDNKSKTVSLILFEDDAETGKEYRITVEEKP